MTGGEVDLSGDDLAAFGITDRPPETKKEYFEVWPENVEIVQVFTRCATQWRVSTGGLIGLDYSVLFHIMELYGIKDKKAVFEGVQVMEATALDVSSRKAAP